MKIADKGSQEKFSKILLTDYTLQIFFFSSRFQQALESFEDANGVS